MSPAAAERSTRSRTSVSIRSELVAPSAAISSSGRSSGAQHAGAQGVVDVVVDVGDPVDEPDDPPLERGRQIGTGVAQDPVAHLLGEVEPGAVALDPLDHAQRVVVVAEADPEALAQARVEHLLADVAERRVAEVVAERDRLGEVLVQRERARDRARDACRLERVREPRAVVVALRRDEHLRLVLEPAERLRVHDPVAVALERRAKRRVRLGRGARSAGYERAASGDSQRVPRPRACARGRRLRRLTVASRPIVAPRRGG